MDGRRGALLLITVVELVVLLDATVVNIALPAIGASLGLGEAALSWVTNAYLLAFGGCMLLGGRAADLLGPRRVFRAGLALFTVASAAAGLAPTATVLIAARVAQGVAAAVVVPAQLALLTATFTAPDARRRAFGVWSAMGASGAAIGTALGGVLTQALGWPSIFLINVPVGVVALGLVARLLPADPVVTGPRRLDIRGAVTGTAALVLLGYGLPALHGDPATAVVTLVAGAVLLVVFLVVEARAAEPVMPLRLYRIREVSVTAVINALVGAAHVPAFALLALYLQNTQQYTPVQSGLAVLPVAVVGIVAARTALPGVLARIGGPGALALGLALQTVALAWYALLPPAADYLTDILLPSLIFGAGLPTAFAGATVPAVTAVGQSDAGIAGGIVGTAQRAGSGLGVAVVLVLAEAVTTSRGYLAGLHAGFLTTAAFATAGSALALALLRPTRTPQPAGEAP
ncbi:MFS transporter [Amycolatopsis thermalba]|uniref:MFS transporter n=1 Tax=Amycolatopsis thermalba TaxID=944492 RepID=A0ABY4P3U0_9PSEU|nr:MULTISPECIES: MFS transporter [Amycolatopsis]UQS27009.1 MFS transporter [Amycolatopsis thermalba]